MKKIFTTLLIGLLVFNNLIFPVQAAVDNTIKLSYEGNATPIIKDQYEKDVYAVDKDYFNETTSLIIENLDFGTTFDYTLKLFFVGSGDLVYQTTGSSTNGKIELSLKQSLPTGNYNLELTLSQGSQTVVKTIEIGYYYYYLMNVTSTYLNGTMMNTTPAVNQPDFSTSGLLSVSRTKLVQDNAVNIVLSNLTNFDKTKQYRYKVEYQIFEGGNFYNDTLIDPTIFTPQDQVTIRVDNIKDSVNLAINNYNLILSIIDDDINTVVYEARIEYLLNGFLLEEGNILDSNKEKFDSIADEKNQMTKVYLPESKDTQETYYLQVNGEGLSSTKTYYYQLEYHHKDGSIQKTPTVSVKGSALKTGVAIDSTSLKDITSLKILVRETASETLQNSISYEYQLHTITLDTSLEVDTESKTILVSHKTTINELKNIVKIDGILDNNYQVTFINLGTNNKLKTTSKMKVTYQGKTVSEYTIIVLGDINGDGNISMSDVIKLRKHIAGITSLNEIESIAANVNKDKTLSMSDVIKLRKHIAGIESLN